MEKLTFISFKGGTGKTTITVNIAAGLARQKKKVLIIDLDSQGGATRYLGFPKTGIFTVADVFSGDKTPEQVIQPVQNSQNLFLMPSNLNMSGIEQSLRSHKELKVIVDQLDFDIVAIDTPPSWGILTINALTAVEKAVLIAQTKYLSIDAFLSLVEMMKNVKEELNPNLRIAAVIPSMMTHTNMTKNAVEDLKEVFKDLVMPGIRENIKLAEAAQANQSIYDFDSKSIGATDFNALLKVLSAKALAL